MARGPSREHYFKDQALTTIASAQSVTETYAVQDEAVYNCERHGAVALLATWTTLQVSGTVTTLTFKVEFSVDGTNWFQETEEDTSSDVTLKERTLTAANFSNGDDFLMAEIQTGSYRYLRIYMKTTGTTGVSLITVYAAGGAE